MSVSPVVGFAGCQSRPAAVVPLPFLLFSSLAFSALVSLGAQARPAGRGMDSLETRAFSFGVSGNRAGVVRVTVRAGPSIATVAVRGEAVKRFGDSAAVLLAGAPQPVAGGPYALAGPKMRLTYAAGDRGAVVHFVVDGSAHVDVEPTREDALRIVGLLRGAAFWAAEQERVAEGIRQPPTPGAAPETYFEYQVDRPAFPRQDNPPPTYPPMLRSANVEGDVLAQFVVDTLGRVVPGTFRVLKSTHDLFTAAVREAVAHYAFQPAELGGHKVRQLVQMPFDFSLPPGS